jgi:L-iditol 2-dehydrogenase
MKALVLKEYGKFELLDVETPKPGPGEVLLRVAACGICGSDTHGMDGSTGRRRPPVVMGHEASGVVESLGHGVTGWNPGDRVTFDSTVYCGRCTYCREGRVNLCDHREVLGVSCADYRRAGAFAEFVAVPERILYRLPDAVPFAHAAMVEPVSVAVHAVHRTPLPLNATAVVIGSGMIGLLVVQALKAAGCGLVIATDLDEGRLETARALGAGAVLRGCAEEVAKDVRDLTGGQGADAVFEVVGARDTVSLAIACARKGGSVTLVGNLSPGAELPLQSVVTREITLFGSCASSGEYPLCLDLMAAGKIQVAPLLSAEAPLADGAAWFQRLYAREPGLMKIVLNP